MVDFCWPGHQWHYTSLSKILPCSLHLRGKSKCVDNYCIIKEFYMYICNKIHLFKYYVNTFNYVHTYIIKCIDIKLLKNMILFFLYTVQLRGNVTLACYSTLESRHSILLFWCTRCEYENDISRYNHSRTDSLEKYPRFLVRVKYYMRLTRVLYQMIHNSEQEERGFMAICLLDPERRIRVKHSF